MRADPAETMARMSDVRGAFDRRRRIPSSSGPFQNFLAKYSCRSLCRTSARWMVSRTDVIQYAAPPPLPVLS